MGRLVDGEWRTDWYKPDSKGRFVRPDTQFRGRVTADGSSGFPAESGRYHLYVSLACPWAHRTLIGRALRGLEDVIGVTVVDPLMSDEGWHFSDEPGCDPEPLYGLSYLREIYQKAEPGLSSRVTVPVLWDKQTESLVNNESKEILRMLSEGFAAFGRPGVHLAPPDLRAESDLVRDHIYEPFNNGVYRAGFARSQEAYDAAVPDVFEALAWMEARLSKSRFLAGDRLTEGDICAFTTLLRFDPVYHGHFKCNRRRVSDYPALLGFLRDVYQTPGVAETCNLDHITRHYYWSHTSINPTRIVPIGPDLDLEAPHGRG